MSLRDEIRDFIDGNGLVAPNPVPKGRRQGSDNGPMFTSEYYILLKRNGEAVGKPAGKVVQIKAPRPDATTFGLIISRCIDKNGLLNRTPYPSRQEGPDDYYAVLAACHEYGITHIPRRFLKALWRYQGCLNNVLPGCWTTQSFLARQPQLVAAMVSAAFPKDTIPHALVRAAFLPFYLIAAVVILTSCYKTPKEDTDARRLAWHLIQLVKNHNIPCYLASLVWYRRLYKDFPGGMRNVASLYYQPHGEHPFAKYWID